MPTFICYYKVKAIGSRWTCKLINFRITKKEAENKYTVHLQNVHQRNKMNLWWWKWGWCISLGVRRTKNGVDLQMHPQCSLLWQCRNTWVGLTLEDSSSSTFMRTKIRGKFHQWPQAEVYFFCSGPLPVKKPAFQDNLTSTKQSYCYNSANQLKPPVLKWFIRAKNTRDRGAC